MLFPVRIKDLMQPKQNLDGELLALWMVPEVDKEYTKTE